MEENMVTELLDKCSYHRDTEEPRGTVQDVPKMVRIVVYGCCPSIGADSNL
jgi:hypothetical protein